MAPTTASPARPGALTSATGASPCEATLQRAGLAPHCPPGYREFIDGTSWFHQLCASAPTPAFPLQIVGCFNRATQEWWFADQHQIMQGCAARQQQDPNWELASCYGCCSGDYALAVPGGSAAAGTIAVGEPVLTGSIVAGTVQWMPAPVAFSAALEPPPGGSPAVTLVFGADDTTRTITLDPGQVVMLADRTLAPVSQLAAGSVLLGEDGQPVAVTRVQATTARRAIPQLAATTDFAGDIDGHLLSAGGIVIADYVLQLHFPGLPARMKAPAPPAPRAVDAAAPATGDARVAPHPAPTSAYTSTVALFPAGTVSLFSDAQASALRQAFTPAPASDRSTAPSAQAAVQLVAGFYPDLIVDLAWEREEPNVWAFSLYGRDYVILSGALARTSAIHFEGLVMALAHGIARLRPQQGPAPACTAQADHDAFGPMSRTIWFGDAWMSQVMRALAQFTTLFNTLDASGGDDGGGSPNDGSGAPDPCTLPPAGCRLQAIQSAMAGGGLPDCATRSH
jgi:hypothetical protein